MVHALKRLAASLPKHLQQEMKRYLFWFRIRAHTFTSDEPEFSRLQEYLKKGDWALDIGANVGHYTCEMAKIVGAHGRIFAFEPAQENVELLTSNVNRSGANNVTIFNVGASEDFSTFGLAIPKFDSGLDNYYMGKLDKNETDNVVVAIAIDSLPISNRISLVKIDVEGHELHALRGMRRLLERDHPKLIVEGDDESVRTFLKQFGYSGTMLSGSPNTVYEVHSPAT